MTYPVGGAPDGSFRIGNIRDAQDLTESSVKSIIRGKNLPPWESAQENMGVYARGEYVHREVVRLDNRIDTVADELGILQIATFGFSGMWPKPAGAFGDLVFDIIAGASGGGRSNNGGSGGTYRGGLGGYSGGWHRLVIPAAQCPAFLNMVVGGTAAGANTDGGSGATGNPSRVVTLDGTVLGEATGGSSAARTYGVGNNTFRMRGGNGASNSGEGIGTQGSRGSFDPGGKASGAFGGEGENGFSVPAGKIGVGSGGGGGGPANLTGSGGPGGDGGWPTGPGGGGGNYISFGFAGNGGIGAAGAIYVTTRINEARTTPPSVPTNLAATAVTGTGATITWTASTDDAQVTEYEVLVNNVVRGYTSSTAYVLSGLTPSTAYAVKLRAVDENGNWSGFSSILNFTTTA